MGMNPPPARPPAVPVTGWHVDNQTQVQEVGSNGRLQSGHRVYFTTGGGTQSSVFVPDALYTVNNVQAMVAEASAKLDAVNKLQG